ncbi:MAG: carbon monoxide dehydrogenase [Acidobacteria bacterium]|nr:MAG: carbon monoxide dehydrogenase [Acidobacteriota bacterium]
MKIAVTGKGGVGKTTLTALLARAAVSDDRRVFVIDADPNPNLAFALGLAESPTPLIELKALLLERLGALDSFFRLNPKVDDIPEQFAVERDGVRLLVLGGIRQGGAGCACPENTFLKSLLQHLMLERQDWIFVDFEAGLEHLGRATARGVDALLVVVNPDRASIETALRIERLAKEIGITRIHAIGNKVEDDVEAAWLRSSLPGIDFLGFVPDSRAVREAVRRSQSVISPELSARAKTILEALVHRVS